ncbi:MAG: tryptophan synthase subunit alpha [Actinomycetota bacterium]|nr:tryptophan synthase subunit alpha [Actinomycetota bacterium]
MSGEPLRIEQSLRVRIRNGEKCLVPYITGGFDGYIEAIYAAAESGADAIEIGIPFSDPVMAGPTIQKANDVVLEKNVSPMDILQEIRDLDIEVPLAVMTYYNIVYRFGLERFANALMESGISGAILPDLPLNEAQGWIAAASENGTETIMLAAPTTTDERLEALCKQSKGFVYAVGLLGITGVRAELAKSAVVIAGRCKAVTEKPVLVGVGIGSPQQAKEVSNVADGCIVGSAIVQRLLDNKGPESVGEFVRSIREALDDL